MIEKQANIFSAFVVVRNGINLDISSFQEQQRNASAKIREKIKLLADVVKDVVPPLIIVKTILEPNSQGNFTVYEYSPSRNMIYTCIRHSYAVINKPLEGDVKGIGGFCRQSIQYRRERGGGYPEWIGLAEKIVKSLEDSAQNKDEKEMPTFSVGGAIFPVIPLPQDLNVGSEAMYSQEIDLMIKRGGEAGSLYSSKPVFLRVHPR